MKLKTYEQKQRAVEAIQIMAHFCKARNCDPGSIAENTPYRFSEQGYKAMQGVDIPDQLLKGKTLPEMCTLFYDVAHAEENSPLMDYRGGALYRAFKSIQPKYGTPLTSSLNATSRKTGLAL